MSEEQEKTVSNAPEKEGKALRISAKALKAAAVIVIVLALAAGLGRQRYLHSRQYLSDYLEKNRESYAAAADILLDKPTGSAPEESERRITADNKVGISTLGSNPLYKDDREILKAVEDAGTAYVRSDGESVRFYLSIRAVLIYAPEGGDVGNAGELGGGWYYESSY